MSNDHDPSSILQVPGPVSVSVPAGTTDTEFQSLATGTPPSYAMGGKQQNNTDTNEPGINHHVDVVEEKHADNSKSANDANIISANEKNDGNSRDGAVSHAPAPVSEGIAMNIANRLPSRNVTFSHGEILTLSELSNALYTQTRIRVGEDQEEVQMTSITDCRVTGVLLYQTLGNIVNDSSSGGTRKIGEIFILGDPTFVPKYEHGKRKRVHYYSQRSVKASSSRTKMDEIYDVISKANSHGQATVVVNVSNVDLNTLNGSGNNPNVGIGDLIMVVGTIWKARMDLTTTDVEETVNKHGGFDELDVIARIVGECFFETETTCISIASGAETNKDSGNNACKNKGNVEVEVPVQADHANVCRTCGFLEARVVRVVNGADVNLFNEVLKMRRAHMKLCSANQAKQIYD